MVSPCDAMVFHLRGRSAGVRSNSEDIALRDGNHLLWPLSV